MDTERIKAWLQEQPLPDGEAQVERAIRTLASPNRKKGVPVRRLVPVIGLGLASAAAFLAWERNMTGWKSNLTARESNITAHETKKTGGERKIAARESDITAQESKVTAHETKSTASETKITLPSKGFAARKALLPPPKSSVVSAKVDVLDQPRTPSTAPDDLSDINADPSTVQARWTAKSLSEEEKRAAEVGAAGDNAFIQVPVPQLASSASPAEALKAWEAQKKIVDTRLQQRVTVGERGISLTDLCEKLTKETGVSFKCSRSVADDKITVFCKNRTLRDIMRQVNRIFGYVWDRQGSEPDFEYRLSQPVKNQLVEEELRNKDRNNTFVLRLSGRNAVFGLNSRQYEEIVLDTGIANNIFVASTGELNDVLQIKLGDFESGKPIIIDSIDVSSISSEKITWSSAKTVIGRLVDPAGLTEGFVAPENEKNNEKLKEFALFQQKVNIEPRATLEKERLCTSADALEAVHRATGKDVMGDYFTQLLPLDALIQKDKTLFDALNQLGNVTHHRWDWEKATLSGESDWLQFRTAGYYNARVREVPNRLLSRWQRAKAAKKALDATDLGEIGLLTDPMLDSSAMGQGAQLLYGLAEWPSVAGTLRPHWRAFGKLSAERQQQALSESGIGFRQLKLDNQQELFKLLSPKKRPSEFTLVSDLSAEDFWKARLLVRYPAPPGEPIFSYRSLGRTPQFWRWDVSESGEKTRIEPPGVAKPGD